MQNFLGNYTCRLFTPFSNENNLHEVVEHQRKKRGKSLTGLNHRAVIIEKKVLWSTQNKLFWILELLFNHSWIYRSQGKGMCCIWSSEIAVWMTDSQEKFTNNNNENTRSPGKAQYWSTQGTKAQKMVCFQIYNVVEQYWLRLIYHGFLMGHLHVWPCGSNSYI